MTDTLYQSLESKIKQIFYLSEIEVFSAQINCLFTEQKLTQLEYNSLQNRIEKQLKLILDLNLLPSYEHIFYNLTENYSQTSIKIDPGEIVAAEFEIIEQEAINLNLAKVKYIQDRFLQNHHLASSPNEVREIVINPLQLLFKYISEIWQAKAIDNSKRASAK